MYGSPDYISQGLYLYLEAWNNPSLSRVDLVQNLPNKINLKEKKILRYMDSSFPFCRIL